MVSVFDVVDSAGFSREPEVSLSPILVPHFRSRRTETPKWDVDLTSPLQEDTSMAQKSMDGWSNVFQISKIFNNSVEESF